MNLCDLSCHGQAQAAARISQPHIVAVHFVGEDASRHFFAMEYLPGGSLENELRQVGRIEPARATRWMLETARGLAAAHTQRLIHRGVKPANLLLDGEGHIKIADFGLALATTRDARLTRTGLFLGSPGYLSPEQCRGEDLDGRTDIFSLGVTLYELLSGRLPFAGDSPASLTPQHHPVPAPRHRDAEFTGRRAAARHHRSHAGQEPRGDPAGPWSRHRGA